MRECATYEYKGKVLMSFSYLTETPWQLVSLIARLIAAINAVPYNELMIRVKKVSEDNDE